jgi:hypothetical protein
VQRIIFRNFVRDGWQEAAEICPMSGRIFSTNISARYRRDAFQVTPIFPLKNRTRHRRVFISGRAMAAPTAGEF